MTIKGMDGQSYNVTGQGQGNTNTVLGALGAASFLGLNAGNVFICVSVFVDNLSLFIF